MLELIVTNITSPAHASEDRSIFVGAQTEKPRFDRNELPFY